MTFSGVPSKKSGHGRSPSVGGGNPAVCIEMENKLVEGHIEGEPAIQLLEARKHYGSGKKKLPVLMGLDMEVERYLSLQKN